MEKESVNLVYLQTPFQVKVFLEMVGNQILEINKWIVFYEPRVRESVKDFTIVDVIVSYEVNGITLSKTLPFFDQLKYCSIVKKHIKTHDELLHSLLIQYYIGNFIFFSEKAIMTQLIIKNLANETTIWSVDEGTGHYATSTVKDTLLKILYRLITPFLLGFSYDYFRVLGTHSKINKLVLRSPDMRQYQSDAEIFSFSQLGIGNSNKHVKLNGKGSKSILLVTAPHSEAKRMTVNEEFAMIQNIVIEFNQKGLYVFIKPHPREAPHKYDSIVGNFELLNSDLLFENIDIFSCLFIVNFFSSIVIDLVANGFPPDRILSYSLGNHDGIMHLFLKTTIIYNVEQIGFLLSQDLPSLFTESNDFKIS